MKFYIYEADVYCEDCARSIPGADGPYSQGETDTPAHCGNCGLFLERPLTEDGVRYVAEALMDAAGVDRFDFDNEIINTWREFYRDQLEALDMGQQAHAWSMVMARATA
jgi:hypothetical protein